MVETMTTRSRSVGRVSAARKTRPPTSAAKIPTTKAIAHCTGRAATPCPDGRSGADTVGRGRGNSIGFVPAVYWDGEILSPSHRQNHIPAPFFPARCRRKDAPVQSVERDGQRLDPHRPPHHRKQLKPFRGQLGKRLTQN